MFDLIGFAHGLPMRTVIPTGQKDSTGFLADLDIARRHTLGDSRHHNARTLFRLIRYHGCYNFPTCVIIFALEQYGVTSLLAHNLVRFSVYFLDIGSALGYARREYERIRVLSVKLTPPACGLSDSAELF